MGTAPCHLQGCSAGGWSCEQAVWRVAERAVCTLKTTFARALRRIVIWKPAWAWPKCGWIAGWARTQRRPRQHSVRAEVKFAAEIAAETEIFYWGKCGSEFQEREFRSSLLDQLIAGCKLWWMKGWLNDDLMVWMSFWCIAQSLICGVASL